MTLSEFIKYGRETLKGTYPDREARNIIALLCRERLGVKEYECVTEPGLPVPDGLLPELENDIARLAAWEPVQYVLGTCEFFGESFNVSPDVLIPRPETELLVQEALHFALNCGEKPEVLDLCTGSGCIAWTIQNEVKDALVKAVDISAAALEVARAQFPGRRSPEFIKADILGPVPKLGSFDLIVSNPPYIMEKEKSSMRRNVLDWEPGNALFVPDEDPLVFYRAVARWSRSLLKAGGCGFVEINELLGEETSELFRAEGFPEVELMRDLAGKDRIVKFR